MINLEEALNNAKMMVECLPDGQQKTELKNYLENISHNPEDWHYDNYVYPNKYSLDANATDEELQQQRKEILKKHYDEYVGLNDEDKNNLVERDFQDDFQDYLECKVISNTINGKNKVVSFNIRKNGFSVDDYEKNNKLIGVNKRGKILEPKCEKINELGVESVKYKRKPKEQYFESLDCHKTSNSEEHLIIKDKHISINCSPIEHMDDNNNQKQIIKLNLSENNYIQRLDKLDTKFDNLRPEGNYFNTQHQGTSITDSHQINMKVANGKVNIINKHIVRNNDRNFVETDEVHESEVKMQEKNLVEHLNLDDYHLNHFEIISSENNNNEQIVEDIQKINNNENLIDNNLNDEEQTLVEEI